VVWQYQWKRDELSGQLSLVLLAKQGNPQRLKDIIDAAALSLSSPADNDDNNSDSTVSVVAPWEV